MRQKGRRDKWRVRERGKEGGREGGRKGGREGERERGREGGKGCKRVPVCIQQPSAYTGRRGLPHSSSLGRDQSHHCLADPPTNHHQYPKEG